MKLCFEEYVYNLSLSFPADICSSSIEFFEILAANTNKIIV